MANIKLVLHNPGVGRTGNPRFGVLVWLQVVACYADERISVGNGDPGLPPFSGHHTSIASYSDFSRSAQAALASPLCCSAVAMSNGDFFPIERYRQDDARRRIDGGDRR